LFKRSSFYIVIARPNLHLHSTIEYHFLVALLLGCHGKKLLCICNYDKLDKYINKRVKR